jgi:hypothetical protein
MKLLVETIRIWEGYPLAGALAPFIVPLSPTYLQAPAVASLGARG